LSSVNILPARALGIRGLGLGPDDPCYDPDHPWYLPDIFNDSVECACMAAAGTSVYPIGQQCATVSGVAQTMGSQAGAVVGDVAQVAGGVVGGATSGVSSGLAATLGLSGTALLIGGAVIVGLILYVALKK
jgi:hypothetical protein